MRDTEDACLMTPLDPPDDPAAVHQRLADELDRLEAEQQAVNLRSKQALEECKRKIDALRKRIELLKADLMNPDHGKRGRE
jgi:hypothetical protein